MSQRPLHALRHGGVELARHQVLLFGVVESAPQSVEPRAAVGLGQDGQAIAVSFAAPVCRSRRAPPHGGVGGHRGRAPQRLERLLHSERLLKEASEHLLSLGGRPRQDEEELEQLGVRDLADEAVQVELVTGGGSGALPGAGRGRRRARGHGPRSTLTDTTDRHSVSSTQAQTNTARMDCQEATSVKGE